MPFVNKLKHSKMLHQQAVFGRHTLVYVTLFIVLHQLYVANAYSNQQKRLNEKAKTTPVTQEYNVIFGRNELEPLENLQEHHKKVMINNNTKRTKRSSSSNNFSSTAKTPSGTFVLPNSNNKMTELQNILSQVVADIQQLRNLSTLSVADKERISALESTITIIVVAIENKNREAEQANSKFAQDVISTFNTIRKDINDVKSKAAEEEKSQKQTKLRQECIDAIESLDFTTAEKKLNEIDDEKKINFIVHKVYKHAAGNFDRVLQFGEAIQNVRRSLLVLKALSYELVSNGHNDIPKSIKLLKGIRGNTKFVNDIDKKEAESFESSLRNLIKGILKAKLESGMLSNNCKNNEELKGLADIVFEFERQLFKETIHEVVVFGKLETIELLSCLHANTSKYIVMQQYGFDAKIRQMERNKGLYKNAVFRLAHHIKEYSEIDTRKYPNLFELRDYAIGLKMKLPYIVRLLIFPTKLYIRNVACNEYLFAVNDGFEYDTERRQVFTLVLGDTVYQGAWLFEYIYDKDCFHIKNTYHNEYLYAAYVGLRHDEQRRRVFTWIPKGTDSEQFCWKVELDRDVPGGIHMKNVQYNEYLFADHDRKHNEFVRYVFTFIPGTPRQDSLWQVTVAIGWK